MTSPEPTDKSLNSALPSQTRSRFAVLLFVTGLATAAIGWLASVSMNRSGASSEAVSEVVSPIHAAIVRLDSIPAPELTARYRGDVKPRRESSLAFRRSGRVAEVLVNDGDVVARGELLARLETSDLDAREALAKAQVGAAKAALDEAIAGPRRQSILVAAATADAIEAELASAAEQLAREESLRQRGAGSQQAFDVARFTVDRLVASLEGARARLDELQEGTRHEQIAAAKANLAAAEATLDDVAVQRADSLIQAPYDGLIASRVIDEGAIASPTESVLTLVETPPLEAHFGVPADVAERLRVGQVVQVEIGSGSVTADGSAELIPVDMKGDARLKPVSAPEKSRQGTIVRMQPRVDATTRTRGLDVRLKPEADDAQSEAALIGQTASLLVPWNLTQPALSSRTQQFWVNSSALVRGVRGLWSLYAMNVDPKDPSGETGLIERRDVRVLRTAGPMSLIDGNVDALTWIVVEGTHRLSPGVRIVAHRQSEPRAITLIDRSVTDSGEPR